VTRAAAAVLFVVAFLTARTDHGPTMLAAGVLVLASAVLALAIWSHRADPPQWTPPALWTGRPIR